MHGTRLGLLLALLLALATTGTHAQTRFYSIALVVPQPEGIPYLQATGAPPLRFQNAEAPLHPAPSAPVPDAPPPPAAAAPESAASSDVESKPEPIATDQPPGLAPDLPPPASIPDTTAAPEKTPAPILPDETRPTIRPEDFLPYFQVPGSARTPADVTLLVPAPKAPPTPGPLPPSSATYTQTPQ